MMLTPEETSQIVTAVVSVLTSLATLIGVYAILLRQGTNHAESRAGQQVTNTKIDAATSLINGQGFHLTEATAKLEKAAAVADAQNQLTQVRALAATPPIIVQSIPPADVAPAPVDPRPPV